MGLVFKNKDGNRLKTYTFVATDKQVQDAIDKRIADGTMQTIDINTQTPTFTQASTRSNIVSGEKLSVIFGKIMKFFADLKTVAFTGSYNDLSNKPTIPTNTWRGIQNNLTSTSTTDSLSAAQGKVLNDNKIAYSDIVKSTTITADKKVMDGKTLSDKLATIDDSLIKEIDYATWSQLSDSEKVAKGDVIVTDYPIDYTHAEMVSELAKKVDKTQIVKSTTITEDNKLMDGKTVSSALAELRGKIMYQDVTFAENVALNSEATVGYNITVPTGYTPISITPRVSGNDWAHLTMMVNTSLTRVYFKNTKSTQTTTNHYARVVLIKN